MEINQSKRGEKMIFLKHVQYKFRNRDDLDSKLDHVQETAKKISGVRLRDFFILQERNECILVMECPDKITYQKWRKLCPPPPEAKEWVEPAILAEEF